MYRNDAGFPNPKIRAKVLAEIDELDARAGELDDMFSRFVYFRTGGAPSRAAWYAREQALDAASCAGDLARAYL